MATGQDDPIEVSLLTAFLTAYEGQVPALLS